MRKLLALLLLSLFVIIVFFLWKSEKPASQVVVETVEKMVEEKASDDNRTNFTASFQIITNGTVRTFTQAMYHNQSEDVYIESSSPNTVSVKKDGITWDDFFKTLPFSLTKECLTTGTGQTFCTNASQTLRFFLNDVETPDALDLEIKPNDSLKINYNTD